jgi:hypothetical protein
LKRPSEYIKDGFDWVFGKIDEGMSSLREGLSKAGAPNWLLNGVDKLAWSVQCSVGIVEGAINAVVGLGEVIWDITQDPIGIGTAICEGVADGAVKAWDWVSDGDNWEKAAESTWNFVSSREEWDKAITKAGEWLEDNPRKVGNFAGEVAEVAAEIYFTAGAATAAKAGAKVTQEVVEEVVEKGAKEAIEEAAEKGLREGAERGVREAAEGGAKGTIAKVVARIRIAPKPPFKRSLRHNTDALKNEFERQLREQQDAINKMSVRDWLTNRNNFNTRNRADYNKAAREARERFRTQELDRRTNQYLQDNPNASIREAQDAAERSMRGQSALHNPDGVAGGKVDDITGMGDSGVNSSIGSQWGHGRAGSIESQVKNAYGIPPNKIEDIPPGDLMDVDLMSGVAN